MALYHALLVVLLGAGLAASPPVPFPVHIDAIYHGLWQKPLTDDYGQVFMQIVEDDGEEGDSAAASWSIVRGGLILRQSSGHDDAYLGLDGVYASDSGTLLLFSNVPDWMTRPDVRIITGANSSTISDFHPDLTYLDASSIESCQVVIQLKVMPLIHSSTLSFDPVTFETIWRQGSTSMDRLTISGTMQSANCAFNMTMAMSSARSPAFIDRASRFSLMASAAAIAQMLMTLKQIQSAHVGRVSLGTVATLALLDAYLCVVHIGVGMRVPDLWLSFVILTMIEFLLFSVFQVRLIFMIWKANNRDVFDLASLEERRQLINRLHTGLFAFVLLGLFGIFFTTRHYENLVTVALQSPWVLQIVFNVRHNTSRGLLPKYVVVMAFTRLLLPLYKFGDPSNYMENPLDYTFCYLLLVWIGIQVTVLYLQDRIGPRFFIPAAFKPAKYDYFRLISIGDGQDVKTAPIVAICLIDATADVCAICMTEIMEDVESQGGPAASEIMITPCAHQFHSVCLITWMEQKMECPNCRMSLPPL